MILSKKGLFQWKGFLEPICNGLLAFPKMFQNIEDWEKGQYKLGFSV